MTDAEFDTLFTAQLSAALSAAGVSNASAKRGFQPRQVGPNSAPTLYFHIINGRRYGWPKRVYTPSVTAGMMRQRYEQVQEVTVQVTGYADTTPSAVWTSGDLVDLAAAWCQSDAFLAACRQAGCSPLRISEIRRPYITDERDQNVMAPSFDIIMTHNRTLTESVHEIDRYEAGIRRV